MSPLSWEPCRGNTAGRQILVDSSRRHDPAGSVYVNNGFCYRAYTNVVQWETVRGAQGLTEAEAKRLVEVTYRMSI